MPPDPPPPCRPTVSVPSIGSKAVQHHAAHDVEFDRASFSTLYRVEGCAAKVRIGDADFAAVFQYPLSGRRLCSHRETRPLLCAKPFQYPLSGRRLCSMD
ncbi:protein of unknown function [Candidatus Promineifilum breve]|uniref:Uncharacterized protein n=1 Tax=Candidatus Promineifilum breve TaxID=1806508 RepID=A0A160T4I3_9CHLR|nr:protein of unknown function [Candidatus Promineifilum breve]